MQTHPGHDAQERCRNGSGQARESTTNAEDKKKEAFYIYPETCCHSIIVYTCTNLSTYLSARKYQRQHNKRQ
ncbi:hypothetical protein GCM10007927_36300 [Sulfitobacter pacificus]|uniref:Uncharacterized protein n=1 Tax=Sulfitobacter pacificus TaxID=1499314 RepID=A0ABQ5VP23_9RHOB|nr:hypothetical protein GCM10007927_36300 [Sulfitobacter pacificus]